jgi:hypothetical protein
MTAIVNASSRTRFLADIFREGNLLFPEGRLGWFLCSDSFVLATTQSQRGDSGLLVRLFSPPGWVPQVST